MCTYGIGLPFDRPIWQNLPPCRCAEGVPPPSLFPSFWMMPNPTLTVPGDWDCPPRPWRLTTPGVAPPVLPPNLLRSLAERVRQEMEAADEPDPTELLAVP